MDTQRLVLLFIFGFSVLMLWDAWEKERRPKPAPAAPVAAVPQPSTKAPAGKPSVMTPPGGPEQGGAAAVRGEVVRIRTNVLGADIDSVGATLGRVELLKHKDIADDKRNLVLLGPEHSYSAQSGLIGDGLPNHRSVWRAVPGARELDSGADKLEARFTADGPAGVVVEKTYVFRRDSYVVETIIEVKGGRPGAPTAHAYFQLVRDAKDPAGESAMVQTYTGPAVYTTDKAYQKVSFSDIEKGKADYPKHGSNGWIAVVQHYFVAAWIPPSNSAREYYAKKLSDGLYAIGTILALPERASDGGVTVSASLYVGPQEKGQLKAAAEGLDLVVDYGWLTIVAWPLFWLLDKFYGWSGNWGVAIILLTVVIKLVFFPLSAASYKSMAKMKLITPRLTKIREMYGEDRQKMNQAMMELYRTEKINPLGGCFPILVQIPVFIALYWVLLAAVELRHAPFILWIKDLSAQDPFYVLPILMAASMIVQTKLNPVPPDPVQAKVMTFMPYVFSVFFFFFPAGLVLYWLINNILSILQQWQIQRMFNRDRPARAQRK